MDKVIEGIIKFLTNNPELTITSISAILIPLAGYWYKYLYARYQNSKAAKDLAPFFNYQNVKEKRQYYVESKVQNNSPTREDEPSFSHKFVVKQKLISFFIKTAFNEEKESDKFYLVLADSGMGKTTFMINLYIRYNSFFNFRKKYKIKLFPFGYKGNIIEKIKEIKKEEIPNTILLLDAFDEYSKILPPTEPDGLNDDERFRKVLDELIETVQDFREVVITSRTQYFPGQENQPYELKIPRFDDKGFHTLAKLYLSPFNEKEIKCYLNKKFGVFRFWNRKKKKIAKQIVNNSPKLMVRPMLLAYIDFLVDGNQKYTTTYQIYHALINKWIDREGDKREHQHTNREKLKANLHKYSQMIAVKIYEKRKETNSLQLSKADATDVNSELKEYQMTGQSLLTRDAENNWKFAHKSILEFFLAKEAYENRDFAMKLDFAGMDMTKLFCNEIFEATSLIQSNYVPVKGGEFVMGSPETEVDRSDDETQHPVKISDLYMCKYTVTIADFEKFIDDTGYTTDAERENSSYTWDGKEWKTKEGINWRFGISGKERVLKEFNHPVLHVSWNDAIAFCKWITEKSGQHFRLPTEAEWEYACRGNLKKHQPFYTGENLTTDQANYDGNYPYNKNKKGIFRENTVPVNSFQPNSLGIYNMHGNVWEWCNDGYGEKYYYECNENGLVENPKGVENGSYRVRRGGSWLYGATLCRVAFRYDFSPDSRSDNIGFRLVRVP